jgi:hypothetical protein
MPLVKTNRTPADDENVTVTFNLKGDVYNELAKRLSERGKRTQFFRLVVEKFLAGELRITIPEQEL